jgi:starch phosphorylase
VGLRHRRSTSSAPDDADRFVALMNALRHSDYYMVTVDFDAYCATQRSVERLWLSTFDWARASMLNIARMAWFSSDRTIGEYAQDIWKVPFELPSNRLGREQEEEGS